MRKPSYFIKYVTLAAVTLWIFGTSLPTVANVVYQYAEVAPTVSQLSDDSGSVEVATNGSFFPIGISGWSASLTFASALAPNSTFDLHSESGDFGLLGAAQGGVLHYSGIGLPLGIVDDINAYALGPAVDGVLNINNYSALNGSVTTDAAGNISAWRLTYTLYDNLGENPGDPGFVWVGPGPKPADFPDASPGQVGMQILLSSDPTDTTIFGVNAFNGATLDPSEDKGFTTYDDAFLNPGALQIHFFTEQSGEFVIQQAPTPGTLALVLAGVFVCFSNQVSRRQRESA
jgi:hypothetical protein